MQDPQLTVTLAASQWKLISFLSGRGALETRDLYVAGTAHSFECVRDAADVVLELQKQLRALGVLDESQAASTS